MAHLLVHLRRGVRRARKLAQTSPLVLELRRRAREREFAAGQGTGFCGVHATYEAALRAAPPVKTIGYDQAAAASMYRERLQRVYPSDYPVIFWLARLIPGARNVFDFGGHVGIAYYAYQRYLGVPAGLRWTVCDVPAVVQSGRALAAERGATGLSFTERFADAEGADVLLAAGSLQYLPSGHLERELRALGARPRHVVLNKLPVHPALEYVTIQDTGPAFHAYTVFRRDRLVGAVEGLGYELVDAWDNPDLCCRVPGFPDHDIPAYSGFYFRAR
jgi:putative methyltransferase (TIGR04325 family)